MAKIIQWVCLGVGSTLLVLWAGLRLDAARASDAALEAFEEARAAQESARESLPVEFEYDKSLWDPERMEEYEESRRYQYDPPLAVLRIPEIDLVVPVLPGTGKMTLNRAVGHITGTALPGESGNVGLAGHRDGFFRGLKDVEVGDRLVLETLSETIEYEIAELQLVQPSGVEVLDQTEDPTLTLVTCYPFYFVGDAPQRFIVRATVASDESLGSGTERD